MTALDMTVLNNSGDLLDRQPLSRVKRLAIIFGTLFLAVFLSFSGVEGAFADVIDQCNGVLDDGDGLECHVTVVNNLDLTDPANPVSSSTVTVTSCWDAAGPVLAGACDSSHPNFTSTTTPHPTTLVTDVTQCNAVANGGGSVVYCSVDVLNQITGTTTAPVAATVNECTNSADGGGATISCDGWVDVAVAPPAAVNAIGADVVQCDHSGNDGGSTVDCSVATDSTVAAVLPITVNQCNYSANLGGSVVICRTRVRTVIRPSIADTSYSSNTATFTALPTTPTNGLAAPLQVVVPPIVVVPLVTPPVTPPVTPTGSTNRSSGVSSGNRLVNTGTLASTGADPAPAGLLSVLVILLGIAGVLTSKRNGIRTLK